jgi:thioredoxin-related protein
MKFLIKIILFVFLFVQSAPTILCFVNNEENTSLNLSDEEESAKEEKEFKTEFIFTESKSYFSFYQDITSQSENNYLIKDYKTYTYLHIIPPKV